ncbi:phosphotransferase [Solirubrobacter ginsenosidimutans]|uniref:Maltokinase n=1 Tax=Solirubrobacter ginsenosidimutans TaxID=490573 RepID=A0A9X3S4T6_9ACTN|nr:phosphotransferase [Solirubrobacter ginsenosidimutans]MDA0166184.1 phosphotransferase [Solirubrobacter ginsenosidimutans]
MTDLSFLDDQVLNDWIVAQRWFASKTREVASIEIVDRVTLREESPVLVLCLVEARFPTGTHETYQVPLGLRPVSEGWSERVIVEADGWTVYDALADPAAGRELLHRMRSNSEFQVGQDEFIFRWAPNAAAGLGGTVDVRPVGVEQSNSSIVFGDQLIMKAFRKVEPGVNPELELLRFLSAHGFPHIASLAGWYEVEGRLIDATLGILQEFLLGFRDGWELALDELATDPDALLDKLEALGVVIGELHAALGSDNSDPAFSPDEPSMEALSILTADVDEQIERVFLDLPETEATAPIRGRGQDVREKLSTLSHVNAGGKVIRTHGDLHLGQTMLGERGWVVLDFEGEPARPLPERRLKRSPLRDVAGMLRSFSYVTAGARILRGVETPEGWEQAARERFLTGYHQAVDSSLLPPGQQATDQLLAVFELEKAVYELRYELNNRPDWVAIPVAGIVRLLDSE